MRLFCSVLCLVAACDPAVPTIEEPLQVDLQAVAEPVPPPAVAWHSEDAEDDPTTAWLASLGEEERVEVEALLVDLPHRVAQLPEGDVDGLVALFDELNAFGNGRYPVPELQPAARSSAHCHIAYGYAVDAREELLTAEINAFRAEFAAPSSNAWNVVYYATSSASYSANLVTYANYAIYSPASYRWHAQNWAYHTAGRASSAISIALLEESATYGQPIYWNWRAVRLQAERGRNAALNAQSSVAYCS